MSSTSDRGRVLIDTNVLAYRYDRSAPGKAERAQGVLGELARAGAGVISSQVVCELYQVLVHKMRDRVPREEALGAVALQADAWPVLGIPAHAAKEAVFMAARDGLSIWDAQLVATARAHGVPTLLTEDFEAGRDYDGVLVVDPFAPGFDPQSLR